VHFLVQFSQVIEGIQRVHSSRSNPSLEFIPNLGDQARRLIFIRTMQGRFDLPELSEKSLEILGRKSRLARVGPPIDQELSEQNRRPALSCFIEDRIEKPERTDREVE
jgi:hypothetical protein